MAEKLVALMEQLEPYELEVNTPAETRPGLNTDPSGLAPSANSAPEGEGVAEEASKSRQGRTVRPRGSAKLLLLAALDARAEKGRWGVKASEIYEEHAGISKDSFYRLIREDQRCAPEVPGLPAQFARTRPPSPGRSVIGHVRYAEPHVGHHEILLPWRV